MTNPCSESSPLAPARGAVVQYAGRSVEVKALSDDELRLMLVRTLHSLDELSDAFSEAKETVDDWQSGLSQPTLEAVEPQFVPELPLDQYDLNQWQWVEKHKAYRLDELPRPVMEQALMESQATLKSLAKQWANVSKLFGAWA